MKKFFIILTVLLLLGMVSGCQKEELEDMYEFKNRADTSLVKVVELLGKRAGLYCNLKVIEIPDSAFDIRAYTDGSCKEHLLYEIK